MKRAAAVVVSVMAMLAGSVLNAAAAGDPYVSGWTGYDAASGQCGATPPAASANFAIINATGGRPFTTNSCLASEVAAASPRQVSLYFNTGYAGAYGHDVSSDCATAPVAYTGKAAQAYEIGCSEASYAASHAGAVTAAMWWLDVETGNSWSSSSTAYNAATIQGAIDKVHALGFAAGVYSTPSSWSAIVGGSSVSGIDGSWVYSGYGFQCGQSAFGVPIWVLQGAQVTSGGVTFNTDTAC